MHFINPFRGLRPNNSNNLKVESIVVPSTDHLSKSIVENHKNNNPWSFIHVLDPIKSESLSENKIRENTKNQFQKMKNNSILIKDEIPSYYIYKITSEKHIQTGIIGRAKISAYDDLHIRGHEEIYSERAQERSEQMLNLDSQIGPIYVIYPDTKDLSILINEKTKSKPIYTFKALDNCHHELWIINDDEKLNKINNIFNKINCIYIADGHHRMEAMLRLSDFKKNQNSNHNGSENYNYTMVAAFPQSEARILDYNRLIKDLNGLSKDTFIKNIKKKFIVEKQTNTYKPSQKKSFGMYLEKCWYSIKLKKDPEPNLLHINNLDINLLHFYLLEPILGVGDPRYDKRLDFISGFHGVKAIEEKVDSGIASVGFSLFPTQIDDVIEFANKKLTMPPKSTWFDPKPLDGLVSYEF